jgi:hypothetical protein
MDHYTYIYSRMIDRCTHIHSRMSRSLYIYLHRKIPLLYIYLLTEIRGDRIYIMSWLGRRSLRNSKRIQCVLRHGAVTCVRLRRNNNLWVVPISRTLLLGRVPLTSFRHTHVLCASGFKRLVLAHALCRLVWLQFGRWIVVCVLFYGVRSVDLNRRDGLVDVCVCVYIYIYIYKDVCIYVFMYACMFLCMYACIHVCVSVDPKQDCVCLVCC